jgi:drug/metabolite transporter (DMT)-like permease
MSAKKASVGIALMVAAVFLYSLKDSFVKMTGGYYPAAQIIWMQYVATGTVFLIISYAREGRAVFRPKMPLLQILRGAFAASGMGLFYWAITLIPLAEATAMQFVAPLVVTALSPVLLGERIGIRRWGSVFVGFLGVLIVLRPEFGGARLGYFVGICSGISIGLFFVINRRLADASAPLAALAYSACFGAILLSPFVPFRWVPSRPDDLVLIFGFLSIVMFAQALMYTAFHLGEASLIAAFHYAQIIGATFFGYLFFAEFPDAITLVGIAVIIASNIYIVIRETQNSGPLNRDG